MQPDKTKSEVVKVLTDEEINEIIERHDDTKDGAYYACCEVRDRLMSHISALESQAMRFAEWTNIHGWSYDGVSEYWTRYKEDGNLETITTQQLFTDFINETNGK